MFVKKTDITLDECFNIAKQSEAFYFNEHEVNGHKAYTFNYRLATAADFKKHNAYELRGICFVENERGGYDRWLMLPKFFNINETEETQAYLFDKEMLVDAHLKEDGSLMQPVCVDGEVIWRTQNSFDNKQCKLACEYAGRHGIDEKIKKYLEAGYNFMFELVSPFNQVVVPYNNTDLILLAVRDKAGNLVPFESNLFKEFRILFKTPKVEKLPFGELLERKDKVENIEGWVIHFENGMMAKLKTEWYLKLHGTISEISVSKIAQLALEDDLDDVLSYVQGEKKKAIQDIQRKVSEKFNHLVSEVLKYKKELDDTDRKSFAQKYAKSLEVFPLVMKTDGTEKSAELLVKGYLQKQFSKEKRTCEYLGFDF